MRRVTDEERRARLARRHHLASTTKAARVEEVARDLVGLHATDPVSIFLSAAARMKKPSIEAVESALYDERTVVRMLGMRRTLFVEPLDLVPVVQSAATRAIARRERTRLIGFLTDAGTVDDPGPWLRKLETKTVKALAKRGEASAAEIASDVPGLEKQLVLSPGKKYEAKVSISSRVLLLLAAEGRLVRGRPRGSWLSTQYRWATTETWLGEPLADIPVETARAELVQRWLASFGPATVDDIKWWTGWSLGETRKALAAVDTVEVELEGGGEGVALADDVDPVRAPKPWVALLPSLDPTTMGWKERTWYLGQHAPVLFDRMGNAGPTVWSDGRVVGGWAQRKSGEIVVRLLEDVGKEARTKIDAEADRLAQLLAGTRFTPKFPTPLERDLRASVSRRGAG